MDFMFDWDNDGDRFSFEDSDRFEEDSLCSWISEPESLCNNWRGWKRQNGGGQISSSVIIKHQDGPVPQLVELASKAVARHIPFEVVEHFGQPIPEQLQLYIAFWSFPENEEDIRLYSCLANGSADEFQKGEHLYKVKAVKDALQIGFHLSATVVPPQGLPQVKGSFNVAVVFDRRRISSCTCTCKSQPSWCSHIVALCLYRIHQASSVCLRAPVSESLSRLQRDQLQKFAQYLISELPQQILPTAQRLLDELLSSQESAMNTVCGAPDPTAGPSASEQTSWCLDESTLHENVKKTLVKFCIPSPIVFSDVNYLSATAPPAAAEWQSLLRPLRGREPEGMWNLLSIVREMFRRNDSNAIPLLEIITDEVLQCEQILIWWFTTKATSNNNNNICRGNSSSGANATQHAAASLCDEIVTLWRLAALNPKLSPIQRDDLCLKFKEWHISTVEKVRKARTSGSSTGVKKNDIENFIGFKPAIEACHLKWDDYPIPGVTYSEKEGSCFRYRFNKNHDKDKKPSRIQPVTVCSESIISTDNKTTLAQAQSMLQDHHHNVKDMTIYRHHNSSSPQDSMGNDGAISSGSEGFCEPERNSSLFRDSDSGSEMKDINSRSNSLDDQDMGNYASNMIRHGNLQLGINNVNYLSSASKGEIEVFDSPEVLQDEGNTYDMEPRERNAMEEASGYMKAENSSESQHSGDEYQIYFYSNSKAVDSEKKKENTEEPNFFGGVKSVDNMQDVLFARAEALHAHGHTREACRLAQRLAEELLTNPPDLLAESANLPSLKGKKKKALTNISLLASCTLSKAAFLCSVLAEEPESCHLAFKVGMFGLELPRPPASCKALEVKLAYQETEILNLLKRIPLGAAELAVLRDKAEELRDGTFKSRGEALLPLTLATVIFDSLCLPVFPVGSTNSRPPSRSVQVTARTPADERLGFDGAVAALGLKANVSEAEHPLLCESTRRQRGELAIAMLVHYKDDPFKLSRIMDKLLDKEVHQLYKAPSLVNYLGGNKPSNTVVSVSSHSNSPAHPVASRSSMDGATAEERPNNRHPVDPVVCSASRTVTRENTSLSSQNRSCSSGARPKITYPLRYNSGKDTDSSAVEEEDELRVLEAKLKCMAIKKKPSQGMASIDSSAPETTSSDNSPTLVRHIWNKPQGPGSDCGSSADSDSLGSSSSGEKDARAKLRDNDSPPSPLPAPLLRSQQLIMESRSSTPNVKNTRYKGKSRIMPTVPNQPSEALAHFMFELSKNVLAKAGGNSSTSLFTQPSNTNTSTGPHRNLHLCAFQIGLYALGLNNCVSPNWLSRTYSSHVSWITGQATDIGSTAINILIDTWEGHLTPPEVASLADKASRGRDPALVKAAADLALSCLPLAQALNPAEVQRALFQCKEQSREMLERACLAVESAAKGGGVYPEVLFDVARQWFELSEEAAKSSHLSDTSHHNSSLKELESDSLNNSFVSAERQSPSTLQVIPISSTPPLSHACSQIPISNQVLSHTNNPLPAQPMVLSYAIPQSGHHPQLPHQTLVQHIGYVQQIPPFGQQYTPQHIPLHSHNIHPYVTFPYQTQPPFSNLQGIPTPANLYPATQFRPLGTAVQVYPNHNHCQMTSVNGTPVSSAAGPSSHPVELPIEGASNSPSPPHQAVHQGQQNGGHIHNQTQMNYLMTAFRVGMLAMETLARRVHDDRPQTKYARNPPHGEDVKWLLGIAVKLGLNHLQQFCASAVNAVVSPFILYDIAVEAAHVLARNNPAVVQSHLRSNILNPLVQKCLQMFTQCAHQRIHHINQSEYDDFVSTVCSARNAFCLTPGGMVQFQELLQSLRRSKSCRKDLWTRIVHGLATGNV